MEWTRIDRSAAVFSVIIALLIAIGGCIEPVPSGSDDPVTDPGSSAARVFEFEQGPGLDLVSDDSASEGSAALVSSIASYDTGVVLDGFAYLRMYGPSSSQDAIIVSSGALSDRVFPTQWDAYEWVAIDIEPTAETIVVEGAETGMYLDLLVVSDDALSVADLDELAGVSSSDPIPDPVPEPEPERSLEAESFAIDSGFSLVQGGSYANGSALEATATTGRASGTIDGEGVLEARILGPTSSQDAMYVSIDGVSKRIFPSSTGVLEWVEVGPVSGSSFVEIMPAEPGAIIDAFRVVDASSDPADPPADPSDPGPAGPDSDLPVIEHDLSTRLLSITSCTGTRGNRPVLGGNVITPVASDPFSTDAIVTYTTADEHVVSVRVDENGNCDDPIRINEFVPESAGSHSQPNVLIDGEGNHEYFYYGGNVYGDYRWTESGPYARRMLADGTLRDERFARLWTPSETHGFRLADGRLFVAGSDKDARIIIINTDGSYVWPYGRQVIDSDSAPPNEYVCKGNRFTKAVFHAGEDGRLHVTWGWGGGLGGEDPYAECPNMQHYRDDSMEVYYAFSEDDGVTWQNLERTRSVVAPLCDDDVSTCGSRGGIAYNDDDFMVTDTRQRQHRKLWVDSEGNVKLGFIKSTWCDSGICTTRDVTNPGAVMLLEFNLNDADRSSVKETMVHPEKNYFFGSMQPGDGGLYFYAINQDTNYYATEYFYKDGETTVNPIKRCIRLQGEMFVVNQNIIRVLLECSGDERSVWLYERGVER